MKEIIVSILLLTTLVACGNSTDSSSDLEPTQVTWDDLIPEGSRAEELVKKYKIDTYERDDPQRMLVIEALEREWALAPVNEDLDGEKIILTGFIVPLELEATKVSEFLLVPYVGACIHSPPPPPNQLVYVKMGTSIEMPSAYDAFSITGILKAESVSSELAEAGYQMAGVSLAKFEHKAMEEETE